MKKLLLILFVEIITSLLSGCLWICRVPMPKFEKYSDEGVCTNRIWKSMITDCREDNSTNFCFRCYYPLTVVRIRFWNELYGKPIPSEYKGERLYCAKWSKRLGWIPLTLLWIGEPLDLIVDTCMIPYDIWWFNKDRGKGVENE